ncbi:MAG TPA: hypothetical protein VMZ27_00165 [Candidatus Saccharimonadales bacterium]|nr:hypothetical protein [Candidatus Saccharimonadales bacterium]
MPKPLSLSKAWACAATNQLAFPGLGTVMAGRKMIGYFQVSIMVCGFLLTMYFFCWYVGSLIQAPFQSNWNEQIFYKELGRQKWFGIVGAAVCLLVWSWSLFSSMDILREARKHPPVLPPK